MASNCFCAPNKSKDYDVIDLPVSHDCSRRPQHPAKKRYDDLVHHPHSMDDSLKRWKNTFDPTKLIRPIHIPSPAVMDQLYTDVLEDKKVRRQTRFSNFLAQMGGTGSYQWPNGYTVSRTLHLGLRPVDFYTTAKQHEFRSAYDMTHHYDDGYNQKLHRDDRRHAKHNGLNVNSEEMRRKPPGLLTNCEYGRRYTQVYPDSRHHRVATHKSFFRNRGISGMSD